MQRDVRDCEAVIMHARVSLVLSTWCYSIYVPSLVCCTQSSWLVHEPVFTVPATKSSLRLTLAAAIAAAWAAWHDGPTKADDHTNRKPFSSAASVAVLHVSASQTFAANAILGIFSPLLRVMVVESATLTGAAKSVSARRYITAVFWQDE